MNGDLNAWYVSQKKSLHDFRHNVDFSLS